MKIHCSGIGGIGLSAYAALQNAEGHTVHGSDRTESDLLEDLRSQGITVSLNQDGSAVTKDLDLFVYSEAIPEDAPERTKAKELGIKSISYFHALGDYLRERNLTVIAVSGTHGKSSTTAMAAKVFMDAGKDPTVVVGTKVPDLGGKNWRKGSSSVAIIEACEYRGSFLHLSPSIILLTTVDGDHFDVFSSLEEYQDSFVHFGKKLPENGVVITHGKDADCLRVAKEIGKKVIDADRLTLPTLNAQLPGLHMQQNAVLVCALAEHLQIDQKFVEHSLQAFRGTWRRMELKGTLQGDIAIFDDYAHHPAEIRATVTALRTAHPQRRIVCVFQPHLRSRTHQFYSEFTAAFKGADQVLLSDPYEARSDTSAPIDLSKFAADISAESDTKAAYSGSLVETEKQVRGMLTPGDLIIIMGAGTIGDVATNLILHS